MQSTDNVPPLAMVQPMTNPVLLPQVPRNWEGLLTQALTRAQVVEEGAGQENREDDDAVCWAEAAGTSSPSCLSGKSLSGKSQGVSEGSAGRKADVPSGPTGEQQEKHQHYMSAFKRYKSV